MEGLKSELVAIEALVSRICLTIEDIRPHKRQLRWFAERRSSELRIRVHRGAQDALNHAGTMTGYFDGYEARGAFQERTGALSAAKAVRTLGELLDYVLWVMSEILSVLRDLHAREPLEMCTGGPTKPGPMRTCTVCQEHLESLERAVCSVVLQAAKSEDLRAKLLRYLES